MIPPDRSARVAGSRAIEERPDKDRAGNYYTALDLKPYADPGAIRGAYRRLARRVHPDLNPAPEATDQMCRLNEAYAVLRDPARRAAYDRRRLARALREAFADVDPTSTPSGERPRERRYLLPRRQDLVQIVVRLLRVFRVDVQGDRAA